MGQLLKVHFLRLIRSCRYDIKQTAETWILHIVGPWVSNSALRTFTDIKKTILHIKFSCCSVFGIPSDFDSALATGEQATHEECQVKAEWHIPRKWGVQGRVGCIQYIRVNLESCTHQTRSLWNVQPVNAIWPPTTLFATRETSEKPSTADLEGFSQLCATWSAPVSNVWSTRAPAPTSALICTKPQVGAPTCTSVR